MIIIDEYSITKGKNPSFKRKIAINPIYIDLIYPCIDEYNGFTSISMHVEDNYEWKIYTNLSVETLVEMCKPYLRKGI